ncbi:PIG-L family deacetylase [Paenochrobactrum sp. BZR 588]|uniref:PIG-L family deacetylase n=1 Tax=unclassified Paenochrobactrum TaxID=2639760 RepID=UPI003854BC2D
MLDARQKIEKQMAAPALVRLHRSLSRLQSTVTMMNTGAHPDDEQSGMLAYLRFALGMRVIIGCSTRGEGGQNVLGPERSGALGAVRSRELEEAARAIDSDVTWLGHGPQDRIHDFGFSKDGDGTFMHWGEDRTIERLVRAYRTDRPDIVIPTFLDVPGQHGHHRAMTRAAEKAIHLAADPKAYPEHFDEGLSVWQVGKYYLPAWTGGSNGYYDDEVPPPTATVTIRAEGRDVATGADYARIGEWSRYYHASQGMGYWPENPKQEWPLYLLLNSVKTRSETSVLDGLPANLEQLASFSGLSAKTVSSLRDAQDALDHAISAFPDRGAIMACLVEAAKAIETAREHASAEFLKLHDHRLTRKLMQIHHALFEAADLFENAALTSRTLTPGQATELKVSLSDEHRRYKVRVDAVFPDRVEVIATGQNGRYFNFDVIAETEAAFSPVFEPNWTSLQGNGQAHIVLSADFSGYQANAQFDLEEPFAVLPASSLTLDPPAFILAIQDKTTENLTTRMTINGAQAPVRFSAPAGWNVSQEGEQVTLARPEKTEQGLLRFTPQIDGRDAFKVDRISYPHIGAVSYREPELLQVLALDLTLPKRAKIGYVGGGADRVGLWLSRMGLDVTMLNEKHFAGDLSQFTTIVVGIFTFGLRKDLAAATAKLHDFVHKGGHLVTLYHRPSDGWVPETTPPLRLNIGTPSLRWRVTDPASDVTILQPEHKLLKGPNHIDMNDFDGWDKERGLYFISGWDDAYVPLLSMHDANEQPLFGALLSAEIGQGRHTHTSLVLHHQLDKLVPGAFRLVANLVQPA